MPEPQKKTRSDAEMIEELYRKIFIGMPLPNRGLYRDEDSLEQPSALKYVPSTTTPTAVS